MKDTGGAETRSVSLLCAAARQNSVCVATGLALVLVCLGAGHNFQWRGYAAVSHCVIRGPIRSALYEPRGGSS